jgi:hypothetical protein
MKRQLNKNKNLITFIIPTKDRINYIEEFFLRNKFLNKIYCKFLIIDGSNKKNFLFLKKIVAKNNRVRLIKQKKKGFMNACFESIKYIDTNYFTFLYDDDILSDQIIHVYKKCFDKNFAIGLGQVSNKKNIVFKKSFFRRVSKDSVIDAYYGNKFSNVKFLPVSPICSIFERNILEKWKSYIISFCKNNKYRKYFLLKKNIGPDLLLYLMQIRNKNLIYIYQKPVAVFYSHKDSMSVIFGRNELLIGYWLVKKLFFQKNNLSYEINKKMYNFTILMGFFLIVYNFLLFLIMKKSYVRFIVTEVIDLKKNTIMEMSIKYSIKIIFNKLCNLFVR